MTITRYVAVLSALALIDVAVPAAAQAPSAKPAVKEAVKEKKEAVKEKAENVREKAENIREKREDGREKREEAREKREDGKEAHEEVGEKGGDRAERRKHRIEQLRKMWGDSLSVPAVREEIKMHARRMARLRRMKELAVEAKKTKVVERIDSLITKEEDRHKKHMETLKSQPAEPGGAK
jgi:hypothetical protein